MASVWGEHAGDATTCVCHCQALVEGETFATHATEDGTDLQHNVIDLGHAGAQIKLLVLGKLGLFMPLVHDEFVAHCAARCGGIHFGRNRLLPRTTAAVARDQEDQDEAGAHIGMLEDGACCHDSQRVQH